MLKKIAVFTLAFSLLVSCEAYKNSNKTQRGAALGAAGGALLGAILGNNLGKGGNAELGAVFGTLLGGAAGAIIGNQMDEQAKKIETEIPGAEVKRVDDGILITFDENSGVTFASSKADLTPKSTQILDKLINVLKEYPETNILVVGHTDSTGSDVFNMNLSEKRAKSVTNYFTKNGVSSGRITTKWYGETQPAYDNATPEGRSKNRRVNIAIVPNETMKEQAKRQAQ